MLVLYHIIIRETCISPGPVILAVNGEPEMCWSANLIMMLYSPGHVGMYDTEHVPSLLSLHVISAFDGPSTARARPPAPASLVTMVKLHGWPETP